MIDSSLPKSYFVAVGDDRYMPTEHAGGAWREDELHLAPVAGLLIHHLERWRRAHGSPGLEYSRFTVEALGQIWREEIALSTEVIRPGRTIELVETTAVIGGRPVLRARAWLLQVTDTSSIEGNDFPPMPTFEECTVPSGLAEWDGGFIRTLDSREAPGRTLGRAKVWMTSDVPLVEGEASQPLAEFAKYIDGANGVAVRANPKEWMYPNVDLTLHFFRTPVGKRLGLDTMQSYGGTGMGLTSSVMHDELGPVGTVQQSLTVRHWA